MGTRRRAQDLGREEAQYIVQAAAKELRATRLAAGVSQAAVARGAGMSRSQYGRIEVGGLKDPTMGQLCRASHALGLKTVVNRFPSGLAVRDGASQGLLADFEKRLALSIRCTREAGLPIAGDLRAWDARLEVDGKPGCVFIEGETHLGDVQALQRRYALKLRDDGRSKVVILVVRDTRHNRAVLREHREALRADFPLDGAAILRHLRAGELPPASGIVMS